MQTFTIDARHAGDYRVEITFGLGTGQRWLWHKPKGAPWKNLGRVVTWRGNVSRGTMTITLQPLRQFDEDKADRRARR